MFIRALSWIIGKTIVMSPSLDTYFCAVSSVNNQFWEWHLNKISFTFPFHSSYFNLIRHGFNISTLPLAYGLWFMLWMCSKLWMRTGGCQKFITCLHGAFPRSFVRWDLLFCTILTSSNFLQKRRYYFFSLKLARVRYSIFALILAAMQLDPARSPRFCPTIFSLTSQLSSSCVLTRFYIGELQWK